MRGQDNEVYRATTEDGVQVVVGIKRFGEDESFAGEMWAMAQARSAGVPVPEVLLVDQVTSEDTALPVMVVAAAPGRALTERAPLSAADRYCALARAGAALARLNRVKVPGFWRPGPDATWPDRDWLPLMTSWVDERETEQDLICAMGFDTTQFTQMIVLLRTYIDELPCRQAVLCHGDFTPEHIFIDDDLQVCGVIDFGMYCGGPPIGDLAYLRYALPDPDLAAILHGYDAEVAPGDGFWRRLDMHALGLAIGHLANEARMGNTAAAGESADSLAAILRRLTG